jgi:nicotinamidase-related amidase
MNPYVTEKNLNEKCQTWLDKIAGYNVHRLKLNKEKSALLVIDMQNFFLKPGAPAYLSSGKAILPSLKNLISVFRKEKRPVIYTRHVHHPDRIDAGIMGWWWDDMCVEGSVESEVHDEIAPLGSEKVILKHRYSAFYNTDLETILRCMKIEDIVITGVMTNMCCESTTRDAYFRDYRVFFPADCTGAPNEEMHLATLINVSFGFAFVTTVSSIIKQMSEA